MKKLIYLFLVLGLFACSDESVDDDSDNANQNFLEKYNNVVFNNNGDNDWNKIWFSSDRLGLYHTDYCLPFINTEGPLSLSSNDFLFEYGSGTVNFTIVTRTADELVLQIQVSGDATCGTNLTWYNYWTFTVYGNSLTFEMVELTSCNLDDFATYTENYSKTTEDIPDC